MLRYPVFAFERTQYGIEFHAFLHLHLDFAFAVADLERHLPQPARNQLAYYNHYRRN